MGGSKSGLDVVVTDDVAMVVGVGWRRWRCGGFKHVGRRNCGGDGRFRRPATSLGKKNGFLTGIFFLAIVTVEMEEIESQKVF